MDNRDPISMCNISSVIIYIFAIFDVFFVFGVKRKVWDPDRSRSGLCDTMHLIYKYLCGLYTFL